jgi:hypothetical protein
MKWLIAHAGVRDLLFAFVFAVAAVVGPMLEPSSRDLWTILPLSFAAALTLSGILLSFQSRATHVLAMIIHVPLLLACGAIFLVAALCLVTIIFAGTAIVLGPPAILVGLNSAATCAQTLKEFGVEASFFRARTKA